MKAYIEKISIEDDDGDIIATISHDIDFTYKVELAEDKYVVSDEFRFIADVLDMEILNKEIKG